MTPEEARSAIGKPAGDDYILEPLKHADELSEGARPLAGALRDSQVRVLAEQYARHDEIAGRAQALYRSTLFRANCAVLAATILGAVMMAAQVLASTCGKAPADAAPASASTQAMPGSEAAQGAAEWLSSCSVDLSWLQPVGLAAGIMAGLAAIVSSMWLFKAREGHLLERYLTCRAKAEAERGRYFSAVTAHSPDDDAPLRLLKLEYFRRYQLDVQRRYFERASGRHARAAERTLRFGAYAVGLSAIPVFFAGSLGMTGEHWTALGAFSVIGAGIGAFTSAHEAMSQNKRNAERYENALEALELLAAKFDDVRKAIAAGSADALKTFVAAVNEQLATEHRQWLEAEQNAKKAIEMVESALTKVPSEKAA